MSLLPFWALNVVVVLPSMEGHKALRFHQKYLNVCSEDELRSLEFGTTWGWVIKDNLHFWVNYPFKNLWRVNKKLSAGPQQIKVALIRNYVSKCLLTFWKVSKGDTFLLWGEDASISVSQVSAQLSLSQTSACSPLCRWRCRNHLYPEDDEPCVPTLINSALFLTHLVSKTDSSSNEELIFSEFQVPIAKYVVFSVSTSCPRKQVFQGTSESY